MKKISLMPTSTSSRSNTPSIIKRTGKMIQIDSKNALRVMKFNTEISKM